VVSEHGNVLALGRTRRLVSRALRRALMIRDKMCRFPGCHQTRHLQAHHRVSWAGGGGTDLENLILLCQWHHTAVHEGGMTIRRKPDDDAGWVLLMLDSSRHQPWYSAERLPILLSQQLDQQRAKDAARLAAVTGFNHPDAQTIRPGWAGERFDLHECVHALFAMKLPDQDQQAA
jgi:HNH endonuclease